MADPQALAAAAAWRSAWDAYESHAAGCAVACSHRRPDGSPVMMCGEGAVLWDTFSRRAAARALVEFAPAPPAAPSPTP
ncbi:MAG: hypothetical protein ACREKK_00445 [Candidatus Methylomirabilales bacterium]